jgi:hypothetical protein
MLEDPETASERIIPAYLNGGAVHRSKGTATPGRTTVAEFLAFSGAFPFVDPDTISADEVSENGTKV